MMDKTGDMDDDFVRSSLHRSSGNLCLSSDGLILLNASSNTREQQIQVDRGKLVAVKMCV